MDDLSTKENRKAFVENVLMKQPKKPIISDYGIRDMYKYYKDTTIPELQVTYKTFTSIIRELNKIIIDKMLDKVQEMKLACNMGRVRIKKTKMSYTDPTKLRIDWAATKKSDKKVYHLNEHRSGFRYRFYWDKSAINNVSNYSFIATRANKRRLASILKNNKDIDYWE